MPQLDAYTFATQAIWFLFCFSSLFLLTFKTFLPRLLEILVFRSSKLAQLSGLQGSQSQAVGEVPQQFFAELQGATQTLLSQLGTPSGQTTTAPYQIPSSVEEVSLAAEAALLRGICAEALPLLRSQARMD